MSTRRIGKILPPLLGRPVPTASLHRHGPTGEGLEMIRADSGNGLPAALPLVHPDIPVQRCWAHKIRDVPNQLQKSDREDAKRNLRDIMNALNITAAGMPTRRPSNACATSPTISPPASDTPRPTGAGGCG